MAPHTRLSENAGGDNIRTISLLFNKTGVKHPSYKIGLEEFYFSYKHDEIPGCSSKDYCILRDLIPG